MLKPAAIEDIQAAQDQFDAAAEALIQEAQDAASLMARSETGSVHSFRSAGSARSNPDALALPVARGRPLTIAPLGQALGELGSSMARLGSGAVRSTSVVGRLALSGMSGAASGVAAAGPALGEAGRALALGAGRSALAAGVGGCRGWAVGGGVGSGGRPRGLGYYQ